MVLLLLPCTGKSYNTITAVAIITALAVITTFAVITTLACLPLSPLTICTNNTKMAQNAHHHHLRPEPEHWTVHQSAKDRRRIKVGPLMRNVRPAGRASLEFSGELAPAPFLQTFVVDDAPSKAEVQQVEAGEPGADNQKLMRTWGA